MSRHSAEGPSATGEQERDFATLVPRQWRASDQVPSGATAPDGSEAFLELGPMESSSRTAPGTADLGDQPFLPERPSLARRMFRGLVRFCVVFLIGVAATLTWQSEGDQAIELLRTSAPTWAPAWAMDWIPAARVPPTGSPSSGSSANAPPIAQAQSTAFQTPAPAAAAPPDSVRQIETMARDLTGVRHSIEQLAARQEDMAQNIATLQAAEQDIKQKIASLPRPAPVAKRKPPPPAPLTPSAQSSAAPPPGTASSAAQPPSATPAASVPRPPAPLH
jgi:hypothetical protein